MEVSLYRIACNIQWNRISVNSIFCGRSQSMTTAGALT
jgi:hypothetical protein